MKVPPKRKGNAIHQRAQRLEQLTASMKVPPKRKGNWGLDVFAALFSHASMKVPPKRKGNKRVIKPIQEPRNSLNESPSEKEGKSRTRNT